MHRLLKKGSLVRSALLATALFTTQCAYAQSVPKVTAPQVDNPTHVLFVGNSYLYYGDSVHNHVRRMRAAAQPAITEKELNYKSATIGGSRLAHHAIEHLTTPGKIGVTEPFQLVILQGGSSEPLTEKGRFGFLDTARAFNKTIRERGGKTALYMTQAYVAPHKKAKPENFSLTREMYVSVANDIDALVIPVGQAFEVAYRRRPDLKLHKHYDGSHPDLIGTYLAACTVYASIYGQSPVGNSYDYFGKIDAQTVKFLQQVAADTVKMFYTGKKI